MFLIISRLHILKKSVVTTEPYFVNFTWFLQDAQFTIGGSSKMSVAFWYPVDGQPWHGSGHYSINCDWVPLEISSGKSVVAKSALGGSGNVSSAFALLLSVISLCLSVFVGYKIFRTNTVRPYTTMDSNL